MRQVFVGTNIDASKMEDEAYRKLKDDRDPEETVIHYHPHSEDCKGQKHKEVNFEQKEITRGYTVL